MLLFQQEADMSSLEARRPSATGRSLGPAEAPGRWRRFKRGCLTALQAGLQGSGLASLYVRLGRVTGTTAFNFHCVGGPETADWVDPRYHQEPSRFERQMRFLASARDVVPLRRLVEALENGTDLPPRTVVVTFDDGYLDHLTVAAPILKKYGIPATFFLPTGYVERAENQWVDRLFSAIRRRTRHELEMDGEKFDLRLPDQEQSAHRRLEAFLLESTYAERNDCLERIEAQLRPEGTAPRMTMNWDEARKLRDLSPDFELGGHSRDHIDLSSVDVESARREVTACAADLRRELGSAPLHFSYPYERWTPEVQDHVRREGFRSALGSGGEFLITRRSDRFAIPRLDPKAHARTLAFATSGAYPGLSRALTGRA
jgi:peptidoglycan/xylan/chitin deacetylase (PgdA/CDA1 family)